jgi:O-succinylbenzoate synthase
MWKIEHRAYNLPFRTVVRTAHGPWAAREGFLVRAARINADGTGTEIFNREGTRRDAKAEGGTGAAGWGEVAPISWFGTETLAEAGAALAGLRGEAVDLADALARVPVECGCVRAGLAAAMGAGEHGDGVFNHVSSASDSPPTHEEHESRSGAEAGVKFLPVAGLLPAGRAVLGAVESRLELGFRTFKWKVGVGEAADEWAILDDLLGALPKGAKLRLDANGAWSRKVAEGWLGRAAERPMIEYVEQPVGTETRAGEDLLRGLAEDFPVVLALDESIAGARDVEKWLAADWRGVWVIKPALLGEPGAVLERLARAKADVVFGSALETSVGARAGLRLAFAWAERAGRPVAERRALGYGVWPLFKEGVANAAWSGPFVRREDVERINPEALWNAVG